MSEIYLDEQSAADTPSTGEVVIYAKTDGLLYAKDEAGVETKLSNEESSERASNVYDLVYKNADYTMVLADDGTIITYQTTDITITVPLASTLPNDGTGKEFIIINLGATGSVTVKHSGTEVMSNGMAECRVNYKENYRFAGAYPTLGQGWVRTGTLHRELQVRRNADWADGNFNSFTGIPWDTEDHNSDTHVFGFSTTTNPSRLIAKADGEWTLSCFGTFDSTGGGSWLGYIRVLKNGTDVIAGSEHHTGNYQSEDAMVVIASMLVEMEVDDYLEIQLDHTNLTGDATGFTCSVRTVI